MEPGPLYDDGGWAEDVVRADGGLGPRRAPGGFGPVIRAAVGAVVAGCAAEMALEGGVGSMELNQSGWLLLLLLFWVVDR